MNVTAPLHALTVSAGQHLSSCLLSGMERQACLCIQQCVNTFVRDNLKALSDLIESIRSICLACKQLCLMTPSCTACLTLKPDTWIPKVLWKMSHGAREGYECNMGLKDIDSCPPCLPPPSEHIESSSMCFSVEQRRENAQRSMFPLSLLKTTQHKERGQAVRNRSAYSDFSHVRKEEEAGTHK